MSIRIGKAVVGGLAGTAVMTMVGLWAAPMMGIPRMNPAEMLAGAMGGVQILGWLGHVMIGITLAIGYAVLAGYLPGSPIVRGALYSVAPWLMAQLVVMPMMGMPLFSGAASLALGSLIGHLVYGSIVGATYGAPTRAVSGSVARTAAARSV
jgi:uncharacterized membrane protein YagU involved in acid resistance